MKKQKALSKLLGRSFLSAFVFGITIAGVVFAANTIISVTTQTISSGDSIGAGWYQSVNDKLVNTYSQTQVDTLISNLRDELNILIGSDSIKPGLSCQDILDKGGSTGDGNYWIISGGNTFQVYCDMTTDGGGWTRTVYYKKDSVIIWNAWDDNYSDITNQNAYGINMKQFSSTTMGTDLEMIFKIDGVARGKAYKNIDIQNAFAYRPAGDSSKTVRVKPQLRDFNGSTWVTCNRTYSDSDAWYWGFSESNSSATCASRGYGGGLLLHRGGTDNKIGKYYGLYSGSSSSFTDFEAFVR